MRWQINTLFNAYNVYCLTYNITISIGYSNTLLAIGFINCNCSEFKNINCLEVRYCSLDRSILEFALV